MPALWKSNGKRTLPKTKRQRTKQFEKMTDEERETRKNLKNERGSRGPSEHRSRKKQRSNGPRQDEKQRGKIPPRNNEKNIGLRGELISMA